ncbi:MAG: hypothetical protein GWP74_17225, partial [Proteobacteria bacterium]|nr:hypothetical protein [Pseudomonadota bacterium]
MTSKQFTSAGGFGATHRRGRRTLSVCLLLAVFVLMVSLVDLAGLGAPSAFAQDASTAQGADELVHAPAPKLSAADYPQIAGINARVFVWLAAQLHLWFAAFVLAVPIFGFIIEAIGMKTRDERYDSMAYEFIKISITAYSLTAILGGLLAFSLIIVYPHVFGYLSGIFKETMFFYALLFFAESALLYIYYYGWYWLQGGF